MLFRFGIIRLLLLSFVTFCLLLSNSVWAQSVYQLPPNQPEQDACNAIQLCGDLFYTPYSYVGVGKKADLDSTPCLPSKGGGEINSVWFQIQTATSGTIVFTITPESPADDYDFAVIKVAGQSCDPLSLINVIRCNYNANASNSGRSGTIGLSDTARTLYVKSGTAGNPFSKAVYAASDDIYLIMVNNFGNYGNGQPSKGFTLDFTGSTASFYNKGTLAINNIDANCIDNAGITIKLNNQVQCSSIAADGSDFTTDAPVKIVSAGGVNCTSRGGYTDAVTLHFSSPLPAGNYNIGTKKGSDHNTLLDLCNNEMPSSSEQVPFIIKPGSKIIIAEESICYQQLPYLWNGIQISAGGNDVATYTARSAQGCDSTTQLNLHVSPAPRVSSSSARICDGDIYLLPWNANATTAGTYTHHYTNSNGCDTLVENITISVFTPSNGNVDDRDSTIQTGFCQRGSTILKPEHSFNSYLWNTGQTAPYIIVNIAGSYSVLAKDEDGCTTIDTFVVAAYPRPVTAFHRNETLCIDSIKTLDAGAGFTNYLWNNGSTQQTLTTDKPGKFWVLLTDAYNCTGTDTTDVAVVHRPASFLGNPVTKCSFKEITITPTNTYTAYLWSNGAKMQSLQTDKGGLYTLRVTDMNNCYGEDSINIIDSLCPEYFYIPSAFTPNGDGHNDVYKPKFAGTLSGYQFVVYNRWGQVVFLTRSDAMGWDGTLKGFQQSVGTYQWFCTYSLNGKPLQTAKGIVTLLR